MSKVSTRPVRTIVCAAAAAMLTGLATGGPSVAQTACPVGTAAGSATCGPAPASGLPAPPPTPSGEWIDRFGAVAADLSPSGNTGVAADRLSREDAAREALAKCRSLGSERCEIVLHYSNQCVAMVAPSVDGVERGGHPVTRPGKTIDKALAAAMPDCRKANGTGECIAVYAACSMPVFRRY